MKVNINAGLPSLRSRATSCKYTGLTWVRDASSVVASLLSLSLFFILEKLNTRFLDGFNGLSSRRVNFLERKNHLGDFEYYFSQMDSFD